jgi:hypothetical protein
MLSIFVIFGFNTSGSGAEVMITKKLLSQADLAKQLAISDRRVRQLEEHGVIVRHPKGNYDLDRNRRRYRLYVDRDIDQVAIGVEEATKRADEALDQIRSEPSLEERRRLAKRLGSVIGELDGAMRLANALAPESERALLDSYTRLFVGRAATEFLDLCDWRVAAE